MRTRTNRNSCSYHLKQVAANAIPLIYCHCQLLGKFSVASGKFYVAGYQGEGGRKDNNSVSNTLKSFHDTAFNEKKPFKA